MKPDTQTAMRNLIQQVRGALPFGAPQAQICSGQCQGCALKLLEFIDTELQGWETRLAQGDQPNLGDIDRLAKTSKKVYQVLQRNGLVAA